MSFLLAWLALSTGVLTICSPGQSVPQQGLGPPIVAAVAVALDHVSLVRFKEHAAGLRRLVGCAPMIGGLLPISTF